MYCPSLPVVAWTLMRQKLGSSRTVPSENPFALPEYLAKTTTRGHHTETKRGGTTTRPIREMTDNNHQRPKLPPNFKRRCKPSDPSTRRWMRCRPQQPLQEEHCRHFLPLTERMFPVKLRSIEEPKLFSCFPAFEIATRPWRPLATAATCYEHCACISRCERPVCCTNGSTASNLSLPRLPQ